MSLKSCEHKEPQSLDICGRKFKITAVKNFQIPFLQMSSFELNS